ncbi:hypothetical protein CL616_02040 [archaeon]|nr:hypothetical protein [archaeon]|tara:strand:- start:48 stop:290 length:243 start_codon:yes stop_codon:yes gene_type:complete
MKGGVVGEIDEVYQIAIFPIDLRGELGEDHEAVRSLLDFDFSVSSNDVGGTHVFGVKYHLPKEGERRYFRVTGPAYGPRE